MLSLNNMSIFEKNSELFLGEYSMQNNFQRKFDADGSTFKVFGGLNKNT